MEVAYLGYTGATYLTKFTQDDTSHAYLVLTRSDRFFALCISFLVAIYISGCSNNTHGPGCTSVCGHCINGTLCSHVDGSCEGGCDTGWTGGACVTSKYFMIIISISFRDAICNLVS